MKVQTKVYPKYKNPELYKQFNTMFFKDDYELMIEAMELDNYRHFATWVRQTLVNRAINLKKYRKKT